VTSDRPPDAYAELMAMSDDDLRTEYNRRAVNTALGLQWFRDELAHREQARQTSLMVRLTVLNVIVALVAAVAAIAALLAS